MAKENQKHMLLMDVRGGIAELDGSELLRHIRQTNNNIPVVVITGYPDSNLMNRAMEYEHFAVIKKPLYSGQIHEVIHTYINNVGE